MTVRKSKGRRLSPRAEPLTAPVEDYLKAIYALELEQGSAGTSDLAQHLSIAPASVTGMLQRLADQGLVTYERYQGAGLTAAGRRAALRTIRRHRVIEAYLVHALGFGWDGVHAEAERLEHAASDELIDRMAAAMGEPLTDPHGAPIPSRDGRVAEPPRQTLADTPVGATARVVRVDDEDSGMLRYLDSLGLRPGAAVVLTDRAPYGGPLTLEVGSSTCQVGTTLASQVLVSIERD